MLAITGYIDGNTVVAIDNKLNDFTGNEILVKIVEKPKSQTPAGERLKALQSLQGVLKITQPITIEEIREERLSERYGL